MKLFHYKILLPIFRRCCFFHTKYQQTKAPTGVGKAARKKLIKKMLQYFHFLSSHTSHNSFVYKFYYQILLDSRFTAPINKFREKNLERVEKGKDKSEQEEEVCVCQSLYRVIKSNDCHLESFETTLNAFRL